MIPLPDSASYKSSLFKSNKLFVIILLIAGMMRIIGLGHNSFWLDEIIASYVSVGTDLKPSSDDYYFIYGQRLHDVSPPLRDYIVHFCYRIFGVNEAAMRLFPAIFGILGIWLIYKVSKEWLGDKISLIAAFILTLSPFQLYHSQDGRMYTVLIFFSLISFHCLYRAIYSEKWSLMYWVGFTFWNTLNIYLSYFGFWSLISQLVIALVWIGWEGKNKEKPRSYILTSIGKIVICLSFMLNVYLPWISPLLSFILRNIHSPIPYQSILSSTEESKQVSREFMYYLKPSWKFFEGLISDFGVHGPGAYLYLFFFLVGIYYIFTQNKKILTGLILWLVIPILIAFAPPAKALFFNRYISFMLPVYLIIISAGIWFLADLISQKVKVPNPFLKPTVITLYILCICLILNVPSIASYYSHEKQNWRGATDYLTSHVKNGDIIIAGPNDALWCVAFYSQLNGAEKGDIQINPKYGGQWCLLYLHGKTVAVAAKLSRKENIEYLSTQFPRIWYVSAYYRTYQYRLPSFYDYIESRFTKEKVYPGKVNDDDIYIFLHEDPAIKPDPKIVWPIWR